MSAFKELIRLIADGDNVDSGTINRVLRDLAGNIDYVKDVLEAALTGQAVFARDVTVETGALVGMPVYYNPATQRYERALATVETDSTTGALVTGAQAKVWGVVYFKHNSTLADIVLQGYVELDLSNAIDEPLQASTYYLSGTTPGKLIAQQAPVTVLILQTDGEGKVYVNPQFHEALQEHKHYKVSLVCARLEITSSQRPDERHEITNPDADLLGWLPADHASFNGLAPTGAAFGYNLAASELAGLWPPLPIAGVYLEWNKALDNTGLTGVPMGESGLCVIDNNGIWWMSDCYQDVPWEFNLDSDSEESGVSDLPDVECPRRVFMEMNLWFTKMSFQTSGTVVQSLQAAPDSGLIITCLDDGLPNSTGHLLIDLDLGFVEDDEATAPGHIVFKSLTDNVFSRGPVVESLIAGSNITISSTAQDDDEHQGKATINAVVDLTANEPPVVVTRLNGVTEEPYQGTLGYGMAAGKLSSITSQVNVPFATPANTEMKLLLRVLARSAGVMPGLTVEKLIIPKTVIGTPVAMPTTYTPVTFTAPVVFSAADRYVDVETASFDVAAGDIVYLKISRPQAAGGPNIHILRHQPRLVAGS